MPDVTASDLVAFRPAPAESWGEPAGMGVSGLPANVVATAGVHSLSGPLLGYDVTVRFEPVGFLFDYGDGTSATHPSGGATWRALGLPQFAPTPTSHVYRAAGSYTVSVAVVYAASVDFGSGSWRPVEGTVTAAATAFDLRIFDVRTALVQNTCLEDPRGPGC